MGYYLKKIGMIFFYLGLTLITSLLASSAEIKALWLKVAICGLSLLIFCLSTVLMAYREGIKGYKKLLLNDSIRVQIVKTGKDLPLKRAEEYRPFKGFLIGAYACIPLVLLLLTHLIVGLATNGQVLGFGIAAGVTYAVFYEMYAIFFLETGFAWTFYFWLLYALPVIACLYGVPYMLGARNERLVRETIATNQSKIYGKNKGEEQCE